MGSDDDILIGSGRWKLLASNLLLTSDGRSWSGIAAELRRHVPGEVPEMISDRTVVAFAAVGSPRAIIHRRGNGLRQATPARTGTFWLCPEGVAEDGIRNASSLKPLVSPFLLPWRTDTRAPLHRCQKPQLTLSMHDGFITCSTSSKPTLPKISGWTSLLPLRA